MASTRANARTRPAMATPASRLSRTNRSRAARGARRGRTAVWRSVAGEAQSAASAATVMALKDRVRGSPDRRFRRPGQRPARWRAAPPSSSRLAPSVSRTARPRLPRPAAGIEQRPDEEQLGHAEDHDHPAGHGPRASPRARAAHRPGPRTLRGAACPRASAAGTRPGAASRRRLPSAGGATPARSASGTSPRRARCGPAAARDRTCSTATAPTRRPSLTPGRRPGRGRGAAPPAGSLPTIGWMRTRRRPRADRVTNNPGTDDAIGRHVGGPPAPRAGIAPHGVVDRDRDVVGVAGSSRARAPAGRRGPAPRRAGPQPRAAGCAAMAVATSARAAVMRSNSRRTSDSTRAGAVASVGPSHQRSNATPASHASAAAAGRPRAGAASSPDEDRPLAGTAGADVGKGQSHSSSRIPQR